MNSTIHIRNVRQNNLRGFDLDLPKRQLIVVVGVSGSGKSSLVFDTIAAEAGRQINSTFSSYAQNFLPSHGRPDVELLQNLSAAVVIDQRRLTGGPRSTVATITDIGDWLRLLYSRASTPRVGHSKAFSFNDPAGMCPQCHGLGQEQAVDLARFLDLTRSLREGPFNHPDYRPGTVGWRKIADSRLFDIDVPLDQYTQREVDLLLNAKPGETGKAAEPAPHGSYEGVLVRFRRLQMSKDPSSLKGEAKRAHEVLVTLQPCSECNGTRLNDAARTAHIRGTTLPQAHAMPVADLATCMRKWEPGALAPMVDEISRQLDRLTELGLGYLSLDRATTTLSGGEAQRVKMVRHLGSTLNDMLYIFDEPTTGLHARDVDRLAGILTALRDQGNTVLVVEHDPAIMAVADQIVEIGPGAGSAGGELVFQGSFAQLRRADTPTGRSLTQEMRVNRAPRTPTGSISIRHANSHNLADVSVDIPTGVLTVVTGVAGSGKSSLIRGHLPEADPGAVLVDQSPIRASRRSTTASWTGILDEIRRLFARATGQPAGLFSPNSDGGCRTCDGAGVTSIDLGFTDPVTATCEACLGRRFRSGALRHTRNGLSIADVLELSLAEALMEFASPRITATLQMAVEVGIGYLRLGQDLTTLSGGERQRLKLAKELTDGAQTLVLDEPTTGLHPSDTHRLIEMLHRLTVQGSTVVVIEHDLDVIASADHVIDLGPEAGHDGGVVQFTGPVAELLGADIHTGRHLARRLGRGGSSAGRQS